MGADTYCMTMWAMAVIAVFVFIALYFVKAGYGIFLILLGVFKMGGLVKFIPYTIVVGFTAGIAVTIATGQIGDFFGLTADFSSPVSVCGRTFGKMPGDFAGKILVYAHFFNTINWYSFAMAAVCLVIIFLWPKVTNKIPGSLIVIILATVANLRYLALSHV